MKKTPILASCVCLALFMEAVSAAETSLSADVALNSNYVWRGVVLTDGPVLQPAVNLGVSSVTFTVWANMDLDDANGMAGEINETDFTLAWAFGTGPDGLIEGSLGVTRYEFPDTGSTGTTEIFAGATFNLPASPSVTVYRDVDEIEGAYVSLGASHDLKDSGIGLAFNLGLGDADHNAAIYGSDAGISDLAFAAAYSLPGLPEKQSLTFSLTYAALLGDAADAVEAAGGDDSNVVVGVAYSVSF